MPSPDTWRIISSCKAAQSRADNRKKRGMERVKSCQLQAPCSLRSSVILPDPPVRMRLQLSGAKVCLSVHRILCWDLRNLLHSAVENCL